MPENTIANHCCGCKEEVAFKLHEKLKIQQKSDVHAQDGIVSIGNAPYNIIEAEFNLRLFSLILSVVKGEIKQKDINLQDWRL